MSTRAFSFDTFGLEHLRMIDVEEPDPGPGQVKLRVLACSLNYRDTLMVAGQYDPRMPLPLVPLSDGVGEVVAIGPGVERVAVGDRVAATFAPRWIAGPPERALIRHTRGGPLPGMLAEERTLDAEGVVKVPAHLSDEEAATLPCAALTAWSSLVTEGPVCAGMSVLVQGTGGVSLFALQLAKLLGARVMATSSSDEKLERVRALGADAVLNYRETPAWGREAAKWAGGDGVDLVVEVGGAKTFEESLKAIRPGGVVSLIGNLSGSSAPVPLTRILMSQVRVQGILVGHRVGFEAMNRAVEAHELRPVVDRVFPFEAAPEAFRYLQSGEHFGKVVIRVAR
ncbi:MAG: NAD(P)-dependent alcohol dehydrogenase [Myxococcales bacterium]|nr:NAD(P)-dependent alcohol dehydrogenase [Myxococcales bacterium]